MDKTQFIGVILGSAAVGALVSSLITLFGQYHERQSRREELLLERAMELAEGKIQLAKERARTSSSTHYVQDKIVLTETYYKWLKYLLKHGDLPDDDRIQRTMPREQ